MSGQLCSRGAADVGGTDGRAQWCQHPMRPSLRCKAEVWAAQCLGGTRASGDCSACVLAQVGLHQARRMSTGRRSALCPAGWQEHSRGQAAYAECLWPFSSFTHHQLLQASLVGAWVLRLPSHPPPLGLPVRWSQQQQQQRQERERMFCGSSSWKTGVADVVTPILAAPEKGKVPREVVVVLSPSCMLML